MNNKWDIVIIGGGLAGYVAANYLAKYDLSILLLEKGKQGGGRARTTRRNGQYLNLGPHGLYKKGKAKAILEEMDIQLNGKTPKLGGVLIKGNLEYVAPFTPSGLFSTNLLNWKERMEWITIISKISFIDTATLAGKTFESWVENTVHSKKVQSLLFALGRLATYCHAPEKVSAKLIVSHLKLGLGGVLYLDGGWQTIIDQLHNKAVMGGVQVQTHTVVQQIVPIENNHMKLVLSNSEEIHSKYVICTTGPNELNRLLGEMSNFPTIDFLNTETTPVKGATLDIALSQLPNPKCLFAMSLSDPLYFSVHSHYAQLSEDGRSTVLHVFKYHHPDNSIDDKEVLTELQQFLEKLQSGWQKHIITKRYIPEIIVNQRLPQVNDESKLIRSKTTIPGLYIAGDWASANYILAEGAVSSGLQAAKEIMEEKRNGDHADK